jgi:hypothetical protein
MSLAARLGLPEEFQTTLLLLALLVALAPYLAGVKIGGLQVPALAPRKQRQMKGFGPLALLLALGLVLPVSGLSPSTARLQLLAADFRETGEIDVAIANSGTVAALLTRIELEVLRDYQVSARPALAPSAGYRIPIADLNPGQRRSVIVRHVIPAATTERILIAPETARALEVRVRIYAAHGVVLTSDMRLRRPSL